MALKFDYVSGEIYDDGEPDTSQLFSGLPLYARDPYADEGGFSDPPSALLSGGVETADQTYRTSPESGDVSFGRFVKDLIGAGGAKSLLGKGLDFATSKAGMAGLAALLGLLDRQKASGGGTKQGMPAPRQFTRSVDPMGIVRYAANGGLMQAYASGGAVRPFPMQDGGFVMTADAVKGAEKLADGGITSLLPDAKMIRGPGTGTSDDIPAYIQGPNGRTPAKLSNGEAYVPPGRDTKGLYALMHKLERKA